MKKLVFVFFAAALFSCSKSETSAEKSSVDTFSTVNSSPDSAKVWTSKNQDFLDKFRQIDLDSTRFVAPDYAEKSIGPSFSEEEISLFPFEVTESFVGNKTDFQAHSRFDIDENTIGLVARMPGEYSFTALKLFFYDKTKDEVSPQYFELADKLGDAGYAEEIKSWLWKEGNQLKSFTYLWTTIEPVDPEDATRPSRTDDYYLIQLSPEKIDTFRISKPDLVKYQKLLNQK